MVGNGIGKVGPGISLRRGKCAKKGRRWFGPWHAMRPLATGSSSGLRIAVHPLLGVLAAGCCRMLLRPFLPGAAIFGIPLCGLRTCGKKGWGWFGPRHAMRPLGTGSSFGLRMAIHPLLGVCCWLLSDALAAFFAGYRGFGEFRFGTGATSLSAVPVACRFSSKPVVAVFFTLVPPAIVDSCAFPGQMHWAIRTWVPGSPYRSQKGGACIRFRSGAEG